MQGLAKRERGYMLLTPPRAPDVRTTGFSNHGGSATTPVPPLSCNALRCRGSGKPRGKVKARGSEPKKPPLQDCWIVV